jgi:hypothetical protein
VQTERVKASLATIAAEFADIDPGSFSYRYPVDKNGNMLTKPNQIVNLNAFSSMMNQLLGNLDVIVSGLDVETDIAQDVYEHVMAVL